MKRKEESKKVKKPGGRIGSINRGAWKTFKAFTGGYDDAIYDEKRNDLPGSPST